MDPWQKTALSVLDAKKKVKSTRMLWEKAMLWSIPPSPGIIAINNIASDPSKPSIATLEMANNSLPFYVNTIFALSIKSLITEKIW